MKDTYLNPSWSSCRVLKYKLLGIWLWTKTDDSCVLGGYRIILSIVSAQRQKGFNSYHFTQNECPSGSQQVITNLLNLAENYKYLKSLHMDVSTWDYTNI